MPPDPRASFCLATDASERAIAACFSQVVDEEERPIAFLSKRLTHAQAKWAVIEREAYAVVWALSKLDMWVYAKPVTVKTDHNPLVFLARSASSSARLTRWALALQKYELTVRHIRGEMNVVADTLSR